MSDKQNFRPITNRFYVFWYETFTPWWRRFISKFTLVYCILKLIQLAFLTGCYFFVKANINFVQEHFEPDTITSYEIRYYVWWFFGIMVVLIFSTLRLYNAMVNNTRYLMKLENKISKFTIEIAKMINVFSTTTNTFKGLFNSLEKTLKNLLQLDKTKTNND